MPLLTHFRAALHGSESSGTLLALQLAKNYLVSYKTQTHVTGSTTYFYPEPEQGSSQPYILHRSISFSYYPHLNLSVPSGVVFRHPPTRFQSISPVKNDIFIRQIRQHYASTSCSQKQSNFVDRTIRIYLLAT